jgi:hypothetical protein
METINISRKELYDLVWSTPMTSLSRKYLISDNGLRKICKRLGIPMPKAGHWEKLRAGKDVIIEQLSECNSGKKEITCMCSNQFGLFMLKNLRHFLF